jgi:hypothetical protein
LGQLGPPPVEWLKPTAEKYPQKVHPGQPLLPQLLKGLTQGLKLVVVLPSHSISPGRQGNGAATSKHGEWNGSFIPQVKPFLSPPLHRPRHGDFEVGIYSMP